MIGWTSGWGSEPKAVAKVCVVTYATRLMHQARIASTLIFVLILVGRGVSQQGVCQEQRVVVNVRDKRGEFVPSLQAADFRGKFRGKNIDIHSINAGPTASRVLIAVDASGSMSVFQDVLPRLLTEIFASFPETTQFGLIVFTERILRTVELGHARTEILSAVSQPESGKGRTTLRDALFYATKVLDPARFGDSVIVINGWL